MTGRVVTLGNAVVDVVARVPALPPPGGEVVADGGPEPGGGGLRVVLAARAAGAQAVFAGRIGAGPFGDSVRAALAHAGVPVLLGPVQGDDTGAVLTFVHPDGERGFVTLPGAELADPALDDVRVDAGDLVHVSGYGLRGAGRSASIARFLAGLPRAVPVLLDPGHVGARPEAALLDRVDWWSGSAVEATDATGLQDPLAAATALGPRFRRGAVVRLGADGCLLATGRAAPVHLPAPPVRVSSTNGAGDTHVGTFLAALADGADPRSAAEAANAAAAAFVAG
ncbi:MAG TPA: PfkB family carbohydrate kinase [Amnibacterium sp.]|jgi:sugar/nucleoside kinase (ribokinase family)|uniref:PfkB family carbohydrate kinase n=1 Tax=Amnibacterium sp. TaxID=1872496 RepID=UPI002F95C262